VRPRPCRDLGECVAFPTLDPPLYLKAVAGSVRFDRGRLEGASELCDVVRCEDAQRDRCPLSQATTSAAARLYLQAWPWPKPTGVALTRDRHVKSWRMCTDSRGMSAVEAAAHRCDPSAPVVLLSVRLTGVDDATHEVDAQLSRVISGSVIGGLPRSAHHLPPTALPLQVCRF
jgi:hypothetical protein